MKTVNSNKNALNKDQDFRDAIIGLADQRYMGGIARYQGLTKTKLELLINNNFVDMDGRQNDSPSISEFYEFMKDHPEVKAHGYVVDSSRDDYRVSIEGLEFSGPVSIATMSDFVQLCRYADEFTCEQNALYSWWD
jgi:hypothetical protein